MRILITAAIGFLAVAHPAYAKEKPAVTPGVKAGPSQPLTEEQSKALGEEARRQDEARQRSWDEKTKRITRGICSGC